MTKKPPSPSDLADKFMLRLPDGMRGRISEAAKANNRSMNSEIVATLEEKYPKISSAEFLSIIEASEKLFKENKEKEALELLAILIEPPSSTIEEIDDKLRAELHEKLDSILSDAPIQQLEIICDVAEGLMWKQLKDEQTQTIIERRKKQINKKSSDLSDTKDKEDEK